MNALLSMELEELYTEISTIKNEATVNSNDIDIANELNERFRIKDLNGANWIFRKIKALQEKMKENKALADKEAARIADWLEGENRAAEKDMAFFESLVKEYFISEREKDSKFKLSTPYGKITTRKGDKWEYDDEVLIKSLKEAGLTDYIRVVETPNKEEIKKDKAVFIVTEDNTLATADGEIISGVKITKSESINIKVD